MEELKLTVASNIIRLRTAAGMTQAELGEMLNYSDKTISKWERAESLPDAYVLKHISEIFHVSVDHLLSGHDQWDSNSFDPDSPIVSYSFNMLVSTAIIGIWTLALLIFIILWILIEPMWIIFVWALPVSLVTHLVFNSIWNKGHYNQFVVAALVLSVIILIYFSFFDYNPWQLFLLAIPAELVVFSSFRIKKPKKYKHSTNRRVTNKKG